MKFPAIRNLTARLTRLQALTSTEFLRLKTQVDAASSQCCTLMIEAGRGCWRPTETRLAAKAGDALAIAYVAIMDAHIDLRSEEDQRRRYHGTLRPWKRVVQ